MASSKIDFDRNNTSFVIKLFEHYKKTKFSSEYSFLKYYQNLVRDYAKYNVSNSRGLLISHEMGLGKSILAIAIAIDMMKDRPVIILLTKSLVENMRKSVHKYFALRSNVDPDWVLGRLKGPSLDDWIKHNISFVSMNASNMLKQLGKAAEGDAASEFDDALEKKFGEVSRMTTLDGKLLIVDEAHNLFRSITNGSKNGQGLYRLVMKARDLKVMFLTGTPIANDPFELSPCFNMLSGQESLLPEDYREFHKLYVDEHNLIKNKNFFQNRLFGLVSNVKHSSTVGKGVGVESAGTKAEFPDNLPMKVERVQMETHQYTEYLLARDKEMDEGSGPGSGGKERFIQLESLTKPKSKAASTYRVKSRQISNFASKGIKDPEEIPDDLLDSAKFVQLGANLDKHPDQLGLVYSQFTGVGGLGSFQRFLKSRGWSRVALAPMVKKRKTQGVRSRIGGDGPSIPSVDDYLESKTGGGDESWWLGGEDALSMDAQSYTYGGDDDDDIDDVSGDELQYDMTDAHIESTYACLGGDDEPNGTQRVGTQLKYAVISGDVDVDDRTRIQELYNSPENAHGELCMMLLVSSTGAEGLDLKRVRHIHIMEPYWNWGRIQQIIFRGVRADSHIDLPQAEKNVQSYIYLAVPPESEKLPDGTFAETTDTNLYNESVLNQISIESFIDALNEISIECLVNESGNCRVCGPTGDKLFTNDPSRDVRLSDPCRQVKETQMKADEIVVDGVSYYYVSTSESVYGYHVFDYNEDLDGYRLMDESKPIIVSIVDAINVKKLKK
jgi:hypothetical protein